MDDLHRIPGTAPQQLALVSLLQLLGLAQSLVHSALVTPHEVRFLRKLVIEMLLAPQEHIPPLLEGGRLRSHPPRIRLVIVHPQVIIEGSLELRWHICCSQSARRRRYVCVSAAAVIDVVHAFGVNRRQVLLRSLFVEVECA